MKIVLDTNIFISGLLLPHSHAGIIIKAWQQGYYQLIMSQPLLDEIGSVLKYPKIAKRIQWSTEQIQHYIGLLSFFAECVSIEGIKAEVKRDPKDAPILATYLAGKADYLVTGDQDLLELKSQYSVITVSEFLEIIRPLN